MNNKLDATEQCLYTFAFLITVYGLFILTQDMFL